MEDTKKTNQPTNTESTTKGKGKKKNKGKTIDINDFLADTTPTGFSVISSTKVNWADLLDEDTDTPTEQPIGTILLPNAPKSTRGPDFDVDAIPTQGPFQAYMRNLPSEVSPDDITRFFKSLEITNVNIERGTAPSHTVAIVEFPDRDTLIEGLCRNNETMRSREVHITFTDPRNRNRYGDRGDRYGDRGGYGRERGGYGRDRESTEGGDADTDWRSNTRPNIPPHREERGYGGRSSGERRWGSGGGFDSGRDMNRPSYGNRDGGVGGRYGYDRPMDKPAEEGPREYKRLQLTKPTKKSDADSEFPVAPLNQPLPSLVDKITKEESPKIISEPAYQPPAERKKIVLLPPTKKEGETNEEPVKRNTSIFGEAKPIDTTKKLEEIEKKMQERVVKVVEKSIDSRSSDAGSVSGSVSGSQSGREPRRVDAGDRANYSRDASNRTYSNRSNDSYDSRKAPRFSNPDRYRSNNNRDDYRDSRDNRDSRGYRDNRDYRQVRDNRDHREQRDEQPNRRVVQKQDDQDYRPVRNNGRPPRFVRTFENGFETTNRFAALHESFVE